MNRKSFLILCAAAAVTVVLAVISIARQPQFQGADVAGEAVFPKLINDVNKLKTVVIRHREGTYSIDREGQGWVVRERDRFPVDGKKVDELVLKILRLEKLENKTQLADRYERLDLQEPDAKDSRAKEVKLLDGEGKELAVLIVGKRKFTLGSKEGGTYIRLPGQAQTFLARGELAPGDKIRDWLTRDITDIKDKQIKTVTVTHPDGEKVIVGKQAPTDSSFKILNLPKDMVAASDFAADDFGRVLSVFLLDDAEKKGDVTLPPEQTIKAEFEGFAGFKVFLDYAEVNGQNWVTVRAEPPPAGFVAPEIPPDPPRMGEEAKPAAPIDWTKVIAEINARAQPWVFQVPTYEVNALKKKMAELARKPEKDDAKS